MTNTPSPYFIKRTASPAPADPEALVLNEGMVVQHEEFSLLDYWRLIARYRWLVLACTLATLAATALYLFTRTPIYTAETTILIERQPNSIVKIQDASDGISVNPWDDGEFQKTQQEILKSRALAARVIQEEGLESHGLFGRKQAPQEKSGLVGGLWTNVKRWAGQPFSSGEAKTKEVPPVQSPVRLGAVDAYLSMMDIKAVRGTSLVKVGFSTPDPSFSAHLANAHANSFIRYGLDLRSQANEDALKFLEKKLLELKDRVEKSEAALNSYRRDRGIISLNDKENIVVDRLADFNKRLTEAEADRIGLEAQVQLIRRGNHETIPNIMKSSVIQGLKGDLRRIEEEHTRLAKEFKPGYLPLDKVTAQKEEVERRLAKEVQLEVKSIESAYQAALTKEKELRAKMVEEKKATLTLKDSAVEYGILAREVETNRQLYDSVLQRMKEMQVARDVRKSNIHVIDKAELPRFSSYPQTKRGLLIGLILGLGLGLGLVFLFDHLDNTFKGPDEVARYLYLPSLGVVPDYLKVNGQNGYSYGPKLLNRKPAEIADRAAEDGGKEVVSADQPVSLAAEAFRTLRTSIMLSRAAEPPQTILVTSATRGDGKTTITVNNAITFARMGVKVLIIDGDLRRPACHKVLGMKNDAGLAEVLAGQMEIEEVIRPTKTDDVFLVSAGSIPPNPAELLGSARMSEIIDSLRQRYEFIFIDSSPVMPVTDSVILSAMVDGVLLVVDSKSPKPVVKEAHSRLSRARGKLLGVVMNRVDTRKNGYGYHSYGYYDSYYEADEENTKGARDGSATAQG